MSKPYRQLTLGQRYQIGVLREHSLPLSEIAVAVGVDKSTVSRELRRNDTAGGYDAAHAQRCCDVRRRQAAKHRKDAPALHRQVRVWLKFGLSPEQIAGRLVREGAPWQVSHEWVYRFVARDRQAGGELYRCLRQGHRKRRKRYGSSSRRGQIRDRVGIEVRPAEVAERARLGDWEGDTVQAVDGHLVTLVDRRSGLTLMAKVKRRQAKPVRQSTNRLLHDQPRHTLTLDNGMEFADHQKMKGVDVYFADPYSAWQRGSNENANGLIRQYLPKGASLAGVGQKTIETWMLRLNFRPRKRLGWKSPFEMHYNTSVALMS